MKKTSLITLLVFLTLQPLLSQVRTRKLINWDWKFKIDDQKGAQNVNYDDTDWETVQLPHDASIYGPFVRDTLGGQTRNGFRPRRIGWYRKHLNIKKVDTGKIYLLKFGAVFRAAKVWVNGEFCGKFRNGYLNFQYNVSNKLRSGDNVIAVRYDNRWTRSSRWYTGEGIDRNVYLVTVNKIHVARYGTYVTTPVIDKNQAKIVIDTKIDKDIPGQVNCTLVTKIVSPLGDTVAATRSIVPLTFEKEYKYHQVLKVKHPFLWDIRSPDLYKAVSKVYNGNKLVDKYETTFGIRQIEFNPEKGFLLNGRKVFLKGVCLHTDLGPLGTASFDAAWDKRLSVLKNQLGVNAIRLSHNPYPEYVLQWCNRHGILVFDEAYDKWNNEYYGKHGNFSKHWRADVRTFVRRDRNNPSVIIWSVGNEVLQQIHGTHHFGVTQLDSMVTFVHELDPSRKVTAGLFPARWNSKRFKGYETYTTPAQMAFHMDVVSVNYQEGFFDRDHKHFPQLILLESEMTTDSRGEHFFDYDHQSVAGQFYWGGTEYIGESFGWPSKGWINGLVNLCNKLKPVGYAVKSFYNDKEPMVYASVVNEKAAKERVWNQAKITRLPSVSNWNWEGKDSVKLLVASNCDEVELYLNGEAFLKKEMTKEMENHFSLTVPYQPGELQVIGKNKGKVVAEQTLKTAGKPYKIVLETDKKILTSDGLDLAYITAKVVDKNGVVVPTDKINIKFEVSGSGTNAGVCNGDITSSELFQADNRTVYQGKCQLIVRAGRKNGQIEIEAHAKHLKSSGLSLIVK